jgi:hypothetical protein
MMLDKTPAALWVRQGGKCMAQDVTISIFLSVGQYLSEDEKVMFEALRTELESMNVQLRTLPSSHRDDQTPLRRIQALMDECQGVVVVAFPRTHIVSASERSDSSSQRKIGERLLPTVWLQIEAALAIAKGLPTLIMVDDRIHPEGVLNPKHAGYNARFFAMSECRNQLPSEIRLSLRTLLQQARVSAQLHGD